MYGIHYNRTQELIYLTGLLTDNRTSIIQRWQPIDMIYVLQLYRICLGISCVATDLSVM